jgi:hypothetical protein
VLLREDATVRSDGRGAGVYRFRNLVGSGGAFDPFPWRVVAPGGRYRLRVTTNSGEVVTGATIVPAVPGVVTQTALRQLHRETDSVFLTWPEAPDAARYEVRIEAPTGPFVSFVDSLEYLVAGSLVDPRATGRPRVFWPGFRQHITVSAVDQNYHDYYRTAIDPISGRGLIVRLTGGYGVFGSLARVRERLVEVTADTGVAPAGRWRAAGALPSLLPERFQLWNESVVFGASRLSGTELVTGPTTQPRAIVAIQVARTFTLAVLRGQSLRDTVATIDGVIDLVASPARITGTVRGSGQSVAWTREP